MLEEQKGLLLDTAGKVQDVAGSVLGDSSMQVRGKARQVAGQVQQTYGDAVDHVRDMTTNTPIAALAIVGAVGFVIGALWSRN